MRGVLFAAVVFLSGCVSGSLQAMAQQPRYETYEGSRDLPNGASVQSLPVGVVARSRSESSARAGRAAKLRTAAATYR